MITLVAGYSKDAMVLATVKDGAEAKRWVDENGYGFLSVRLDPKVWPVARIYDPCGKI